MAIDLTQIDWEEYNPFKMWGAWIGLVMGFLIQFQKWGYETTMYFNRIFLVERFKIFAPSFASQYNFLVIMDYVVFIVGGFLIGWILTLIWRKLKK